MSSFSVSGLISSFLTSHIGMVIIAGLILFLFIYIIVSWVRKDTAEMD